MSNKLALIQKDFPPEKVELIKRTVAPNATDDELALFLYQAQRTGLDPLARQIIFSKFSSRDGQPKMSIITSIDGYRLVADRTGKYAGNDDPVFEEGEPYPKRATVTVWKMIDGQRCAFTATARWSEYYPGDSQKGFMWRKMPYLMLGKCGEALALRKAFPAELSGLYTDTEMEQAQAGYVEAEYTPTESAPPASQPEKPSKPVQPVKTNGGHKGGKVASDPATQFWAAAWKVEGMTETKARAILKQAGNDFSVALDILTGAAQEPPPVEEAQAVEENEIPF